MFAFKTSRSFPAEKQEPKKNQTDFRAKPVLAIANDQARIQSIMKRFSKSIAYLAK